MRRLTAAVVVMAAAVGCSGSGALDDAAELAAGEPCSTVVHGSDVLVIVVPVGQDACAAAAGAAASALGFTADDGRQVLQVGGRVESGDGWQMDAQPIPGGGFVITYRRP
jgi:predicted regulator of Ras-like GTPase activity (Roadblock/LC7/MglB family)